MQWIPEHREFWAIFNGKGAGGCATPALFIARSGDGIAWATAAQPVVVKGAIPELQDIVYRSSFAYDALTDAVTVWASGARYEAGRYRWSAAVERRHRDELLTSRGTTFDAGALPPPPAPLDDWPW